MSAPRFVVGEVSGYAKPRGYGGRVTPGLTVSVHDRAYCYRVVRSWDTDIERKSAPNYLRGRDRMRAHVRAQAHALAFRLNAEYADVA